MSKNKHFKWDSQGRDLPNVEAHTKARHGVTEDYLKDWIITLCGNNRALDRKVTIIDGFCGGGVYHDEETNSRHIGSPLRAILSIEEGLKAVREEKGKPTFKLDADFIFIDKEAAHLECLKKFIDEIAPNLYKQNPGNFRFICNDFESVSTAIINEIRKRDCASMFILDPTGYKDVSMQTIRNIISLGKSEILFTFMIEYITRFIHQRYDNLSDVHEKVLESEGFFNDLNLDLLGSLSQQAYIRNEMLRLFRSRGNSKFVFSYALIPSGNQVKYFLVHLASNSPAQRVIKYSAWQYDNLHIHQQYGFGEQGLGFKTPYHYESNLNLFDIKAQNIQSCIDRLVDCIFPLIEFEADGVGFQSLHDATMQYNPATYDHYMKCIDQQRNYGQLEVIRNGKETKAKNLRSTDIIRRPTQPNIFDLKQYIRLEN